LKLKLKIKGKLLVLYRFVFEQKGAKKAKPAVASKKKEKHARRTSVFYS
jgi:hypothetical protein